VEQGPPSNRASPWELREWSYLKSAPLAVTDPTEGRTPMSRIVRLSIALVFAIMMVIAVAGAALAFNPPDNAPDGVGADNLCAPDGFGAAISAHIRSQSWDFEATSPESHFTYAELDSSCPSTSQPLPARPGARHSQLTAPPASLDHKSREAA